MIQPLISSFSGFVLFNLQNNFYEVVTTIPVSQIKKKWKLGKKLIYHHGHSAVSGKNKINSPGRFLSKLSFLIATLDCCVFVTIGSLYINTEIHEYV